MQIFSSGVSLVSVLDMGHCCKNFRVKNGKKKKGKPKKVLSLLLLLRLVQTPPSRHNSFSNSVLSASGLWTTSLICVFVNIFILLKLFYSYIIYTVCTIYIYIYWEKHFLQRKAWAMEQSDMWESRWRTSDICQDNCDWKYPRQFDRTDWQHGYFRVPHTVVFLLFCTLNMAGCLYISSFCVDGPG